MADMTDPYAPVAEYTDLMSRPFWQSFGTVLENVLDTAGSEPVLDIGAGTGMGLTRAAALLPRHDIVAIEPSPALRTGLFARLSEDPGLAARVTVLPVTVQEAALPSRLGAVMGINMLGHLPPADRIALWERLAGILAPGAPAVFTLQPPARPERIAEQPFGEATVGTRRCSASGAAEPAGPGQVRWRVTYRVHDGETLVFEQTMENDWWVLAPAAIEGELRRCGLEAHTSDHVLVARCPPV
jgi:SAM-dependent methyltransferase